jgi:hypothetical protein
MMRKKIRSIRREDRGSSVGKMMGIIVWQLLSVSKVD